MGKRIRKVTAIWLAFHLSLAGDSVSSRENTAIAELLASSRLWSAKHRSDLARQALKKALQVDPDNPQVLLELGLLDLKANTIADAKESLAKLESSHPGHPATRQLRDAYRIATTDRFRMGAIRTLISHLNEPDREKAISELRKLFPDGPPEGEMGLLYYSIIDTASRAHYGILEANEKSQAEARAGLENLVKQMPGAPRPLMALAEHYFGASSTRMKGIKIAEELAKRDDVDRQEALGLWRNGLSHLATDPDNIPLYQEFLKLSPGDESVSRLLDEAQSPQLMTRKLATQKLEADNQLEAEALLHQLLNQYPDNADNIATMGMLRLRQGRYQEATELFQRAARLNPADVKRWAGLMLDADVSRLMQEADDAMKQGNLPEAESKILTVRRIKPNNTDATAALAELFVARDNQADAEPLFREALKTDPANYRAVRGLAELMTKAGQPREAMEFVENIMRSHPDKAASLADLAASAVRGESDRLLAERQADAALNLLENAHQRYPGAVWLRYDLARFYARRGETERGRGLMEEGAADPSGAYAQAIFLAGLDDEATALGALRRIPEDKQDNATRALFRQLSIRLSGKHALTLLASDHEAALRELQASETMAGDDAELRWEVAAAWLRIGEMQHGLALGQQLLAAQPDKLEPRLRYAGLLNEAKRDKELADWLANLPSKEPITDAQRQTLQGLLRANVLRIARALSEQKHYAEARRAVSEALQRQPEDPALLTALGELYAEEHKSAKASLLYLQALAIQPDYFDARIALAKLWWEDGDRSRADAELEKLSREVPDGNVDPRLSLVRRYTSQKNYSEARRLLTGIRQLKPNDADVLLQAGRTEQAAENYDAAMTLFEQAKTVELPKAPIVEVSGNPARSAATEAMDDLRLRRYGFFSAGWDQRSKTGDPGTSQIVNNEYPTYLRFADSYRGHWFAHADYSTLDAGKLKLVEAKDLRDSPSLLFGTTQALCAKNVFTITDCILGAGHSKNNSRQVATGTAFGAGYENDDWRFDLGSSPQGFPVSYWVGGVKNTGSIGNLFWAMDMSRRPMPNSLLSYAGVQDLVSGKVWGGVKRTGSELYVGYDWGNLSLFAQGGYHYLNGTNVKTNQEVMVRTGADWAFINQPNMRLSAGVALMHWRFEENQSHYTFGHGGYYSPQDYKSVSLPVQLSGRQGKLSYQVRGAISWSASFEEPVDFYPTSAKLQASATKALILPTGFDKPVYDGGYGASFGYSVAAAVEYQATPQLYLGGYWQMQRSPYYTPDYLGAYFRYTWEPREEKAPYPPKRLKPYYDF